MSACTNGSFNLLQLAPTATNEFYFNESGEVNPPPFQSIQHFDDYSESSRLCCDILVSVITTLAIVISTLAVAIFLSIEHLLNRRTSDNSCNATWNINNSHSEDIPREISIEEFNFKRGEVVLNEGKVIPFDEIPILFTNPPIQNLITYWTNWDDNDFVGEKGLVLKNRLLLQGRFNNVAEFERTNNSTIKVREYIVAIFNILSRYRAIVETEDANEPIALTSYRGKFVEIMDSVATTFEDGCDFNQLTHLKTVLTDAVSSHPMLIQNAAANLTHIDFLFALALNNYQIDLVNEKIYKEHQATGDNSLTDEGVEAQFVVLKRIGMVSNEITAHYFENSNRSIENIVQAFKKDHAPLDFFLSELTSRFPGKILRKFHTDILAWYRKNDLDPDAPENKNLLFDPKSTHDPEKGIYDYWFNEKAILYFFAKNGLIRKLA